LHESAKFFLCTEQDADPYLDREGAAEVITFEYFPVAARSLRTWQQPETIVIGGRACARRSAWRAAAAKKVTAAEQGGEPTPEAQRARTHRARAAPTDRS
jgi:hypothetical protein